MNLFLRLIYVLLAALHMTRKGRRAFLEPSSVTFRVLPNDLDFNGHMNNGRYLTLMDLGRIDLLVRGGLLRHILTSGWKPVVSYAQFRFRKSLLPWQRYDLVSRFVCWDAKVFYIQQEFVRDGEVIGVGLVKGLFVSRGRSVPSSDVLAAAGFLEAAPKIPEWIKKLSESDRLFWEQASLKAPQDLTPSAI